MIFVCNLNLVFVLFSAFKNGEKSQTAAKLLEPKQNGSHRCTKCDKSFTATSSLRRHMELHTGQFSYYCEVCRRGFNNPTNFDIHKRTHEGLKYNCQYCEKSFVYKQTYKYHQSVHTGQYRFNCAKCGEGFNEKRHYITHKESICS